MEWKSEGMAAEARILVKRVQEVINDVTIIQPPKSGALSQIPFELFFSFEFSRLDLDQDSPSPHPSPRYHKSYN